MDRFLSLLGVVPAAEAQLLADAMNCVAGPAVAVHRAGPVALLAEPVAPDRRVALLRRDRAGLLRGLHRLQRRLEVGCLAGPFLPFDPGASRCPEGEAAGLLAASAEALEAALEREGRRHQWDVVMRWAPEAALAARRPALPEGAGRAAIAAAVAAALAAEREARRAALRAALGPAVLALAEAEPVEGEAETGATILLPAGGEAAIEAALRGLPPAASAGAEADLRGPLPPLSFAPLRVEALEAAAIDAAWRLLGLPERLEGPDLARRWRALAMDLHPDRAGPGADAARLDAAGRAYRLLRGLARGLPEGRPLELAALRARSGRRLAIPAEAA